MNWTRKHQALQLDWSHHKKEHSDSPRSNWQQNVYVLILQNIAEDFLWTLKTIRTPIVHPRMAALTTENEALLKQTLELTVVVSSLKSITANSRQVPVMQRMVWFNILKLPLLQMPLEKNPEDVPPEYFFDLLNCSPSSTPEVIQENIRCLSQLLHPCKTTSVPPLASQFVPIVFYLKTTLLDPALLPVYKSCDFFGVVRRQRGYRSCRKCNPFLHSHDNLMNIQNSIILYVMTTVVLLFYFRGAYPLNGK